jgi:hypothetical protein
MKNRNKRLVRVTTLFVVVASFALLSCLPREARAGDIISNGTVTLGVNDEGHLNFCCGSLSQTNSTTVVGLRFVPTNAEATADGCLCEGWGAADATSGVSGFANISSDGGANNMTVESFEVDADKTTATSIVRIPAEVSVLRVTHFYHPSSTPNLYQADVTIENISDAPVDLRYRRVMDWDIEPTAFSEFVTINGGTAADLEFTSDNGFATANPLDTAERASDQNTCGLDTDFTDCGPADHGALFDFNFGALAPGAKKEFRIFYGAAATEAEANAALAAVGAEAFSFGQPNTTDGPTLGTPNTFIFAFAGIGGTPVICEGIEGNTCPKADSQSVTTPEDTSKIIKLTGSDADGDPLTFSIVTPPQHGDLSLLTIASAKQKSKPKPKHKKPKGKPGPIAAVIPSTGANNVTYTPAPNYNGPDSFTFKVNDGKADSAPAIVNITVTPVADSIVIQTVTLERRTSPTAGYSYSTPGIAAVLKLLNVDGNNSVSLNIPSIKAKNVPKGCAANVLPSDEVTIAPPVISETIPIVDDPDSSDPGDSQGEIKVVEIGPAGMSAATQNNCQVTLELTAFSISTAANPSSLFVLSETLCIDSDGGDVYSCAPTVVATLAKQSRANRAAIKIAPPVTR